MFWARFYQRLGGRFPEVDCLDQNPPKRGDGGSGEGKKTEEDQ
jgi:hypothetical protein